MDERISPKDWLDWHKEWIEGGLWAQKEKETKQAQTFFFGRLQKMVKKCPHGISFWKWKVCLAVELNSLKEIFWGSIGRRSLFLPTPLFLKCFASNIWQGNFVSVEIWTRGYWVSSMNATSLLYRPLISQFKGDPHPLRVQVRLRRGFRPESKLSLKQNHKA